MGENRERDYRELTAEELERRLREAFFYTDRIDDTVYLELEKLREALEEIQPVEFDRTAEEFWERFERDHAGELDLACAGAARRRAAAKKRRLRAILRTALVAAAAVLLLAGAVLAADPLGLWAWVPHWNAAAGRYEPLPRELAGRPIPTALRELGITEPVYPSWLPEGFTLTESRVSEDPLVLMEQYVCGDRVFSVTVTPVKGFQHAVYPGGGEPYREYGAGSAIHYLFRNEGAVTAVWYTEHYATSVSGNLTLDEAARIIDSMYASPEGGFSP